MSLLPVFAPDDPRLAARFDRSTTFAREVEDAVHAIVADVRARGDAAVAELTARFDGTAPSGRQLRGRARRVASPGRDRT
jgi:histidinol dehydrogenase